MMNHRRMRTVSRLLTLLAVFALVVGGALPPLQAAPIHLTAINFTGAELLGRPTDNSILVTVVPDTAISLYYEYGLAPGSYTEGPTATEAASAGQPHYTVIENLTPNTKYYYRMQYTSDGGATWVARPEHSFYTQRAQGSTFTFDITSDSHVNIQLGSAATWTATMNRVAADHPDFLIDLGDTFAMDNVTTAAAAETNYKFQYQFFNLVSASSSIFIVPGNHEEQEGWHLLAPLASSKPVIGTNAQKKYFPNPVPDSFYTGDTNTYSYLSGDQLREDYYAWTWGDVLFVAIDPYWYTMVKPFIGGMGGGEDDTTGSGDRWDWTLGLEQFNWLKTTLENSSAKYKFIFAHHMVGGSDDYVRGGANPAHICEWGGYNEDGTTWAWETRRPGWGSEPVHQILVRTGVTAFFHGHDHQYGYEKRDGVVYQSLPTGGFSGSGFGIYTTGSGYTIRAINSPGHLKVTVGPSETTVDYIQSTGSVYSYTMAANALIPLATGWNLVSSPLIPTFTPVTQTLKSITGSYDLAYAYNAFDTGDPWKTYNIARPDALNDLKVITQSMGVWLNATAPVTLTLHGTLPVAPSINLAEGWNLVGYPIQASKLVTEALASIDTKYDLVYAYNAFDSGDPWKTYNIARPPALNDLKTMGPGWGYWIHTTEECTWTLP